MNLSAYTLLAVSSLFVIVDPLAAVAIQFMLNALGELWYDLPLASL